ncbi:XP_014775727.1PREDICTED: uncharacterized protein LOC106873034 [Octopus vulgaris]|uniref:XP_014775727.1PREDICTED: uncharacterized protein LOC106873034 n=1 Tax=Octopus vulgaris TaxID=6645 RepID=A0AA36BES1_OCTVU|nr:XP_014775727.1PREDICTED: uncharacterized protein LOC106873034 [Octopus vulgaris]
MERKAVKSGIFFCLLLCTSFASSFNSLSKYCRKSMNDNSTSGIFQHPVRCDAYIQCVPRKDGPFAHEKICPSHLYFDPRLLTFELPMLCCYTFIAAIDTFDAAIVGILTVPRLLLRLLHLTYHRCRYHHCTLIVSPYLVATKKLILCLLLFAAIVAAILSAVGVIRVVI